MSLERSRVSTVVVLTAGVVLGWILASIPRPTLHAQAGDRWGDMIVTTGPVGIRYDEKLRTALPQDAIYYLDYRGGRVLATVPSFQQKGGSTRLLDTFAERDLVADFKLDPAVGPPPHFLMTTGSLGQYSLGWAPLFVFETTTNQVASYKVQQQSVGTTTTPSFELIEVRALPAANLATTR